MSFVRVRPRLPIGARVGADSEVVRALHADDRCEIYQLASGDSTNDVLVKIGSGLRLDGGSQTLRDWWDRLAGMEEIAWEIVALPESMPVSLAAVFHLGSEWNWNQVEPDLANDDAQQVLVDLIQLAKAGIATGSEIDLWPSLVWLSRSGESLRPLPIIAWPTGEPNERALVRSAAEFLVWLSTGILPDASDFPRNSTSIRSWAAGLSAETCRVLENCLSDVSSTAAIVDLDQLGLRIRRPEPGKQLPRTKQDRVDSEGNEKTRPRGLAAVAGMTALKELLLRDVIEPIHEPERFERYGLSIPNGILLFGPPGCGKTYIARQLAEELGHFFVELIPSEIASPFIHSTVLRIREIFDSATEHAPAILFIDEFEALVPARSDLSGHQQYKAEEVNEFLAQLNGCAQKGVFVIAATNEPSKIDPAIRRTGRLDKLVYVGPPDAEARTAMLAHHLRGRPCEPTLDCGSISVELVGYSASDLKLIVDEAARVAMELGDLIGTQHIRAGAKKVPPSISAEDEDRYKRLQERGT